MIRDGSFGSPPEEAQTSAALLAMASSVQEMAALIDALATAARLEDRADALRPRPCRLLGVASAAAAAVELEAKARQIRVEQRGSDVEVKADPDRLRVAVVNLLSNAIHHSPAGSTVAVTTWTDDRVAAITVTDTGSGIDAAEVDHIFDQWYRGQSPSAGLGLGLWIVRKIMEWHGGRVTLDSSLGHGSTFNLVLPSTRNTGDDTGMARS
jgi:two-component system sensor histidine kinase BaeS